MLASLLRPKKRRIYAERSPFSSPYTVRQETPFYRDEPRRNGPRAGFDKINNSEGSADEEGFEDAEDVDEDIDEEEDGRDELTPLLPIFSASQLDALPVYDITHAIRPLIASRCETTLSWDQLRSPQISQFLVKPIQQKIMTSHLSRATLYALITNCLQFTKEIHSNPGNSGANQTRAMVCELLAIKLLREYTTRELIDALSYEFYPLQGQTLPATETTQRTPGWSSDQRSKRLAGAARISCLEVAIRAQAKRFLAHPVVVQQLEAIWAGTIVFHSAADHLHRSPNKARYDGGPTYGTSSGNNQINRYSNNALPRVPEQRTASLRRSVTLYDPRDASLFKLSRLRVPRYRQFLSTLSFAVLLGLFVAVLAQRRQDITSLEIVFWLWSAGFLLDELVGFNEQGFSLYLMSFWNLFDLGILMLLFCYYCMRLYGAVIPYPRNQEIANHAYDILAANAVLLFPRLFSILDHYRYFSQLLIAFRIMASDLIAIFLLIIVACSGFFVAFTLSFGHSIDHSPASTAYALFQMLMGFTPTAWTLWEEYNAMGRTVLVVFLFICHFVVVTILITVLTNSFMAIVRNANEEHQFLFAVNTISMVKSDALFSYIAPANILAWLITPFRYLMPFRQFIRLNRTIIKITHLPILFTICLYEKTILGSQVIEPTDLIQTRDRSDTSPHGRVGRHSRLRAFSSKAPRLVREPSVATYQKDRALDEVFRRPFGDNSSRNPRKKIRPDKSNVVNNWMQAMGSGPVHPPDEQDPEEVDRLERLPRRPQFPFKNRLAGSLRNFTETTRSVASNPEEHISHGMSPSEIPRRARDFMSPTRERQLSRHTNSEGDDELTSEDNEDWIEDKPSVCKNSDSDESGQRSESRGKTTPKFYSSRPSTARIISRKSTPPQRPRFHSRNYSGATMLYNPVRAESPGEETDTPSMPLRPRAETPDRAAPISTSADQWTMQKRNVDADRARNSIARSNPMSVPDMGGLMMEGAQPRGRRQASLLFGLGSDLGDNKAIANEFLGAVPSSFTTQMAYATGGIRRPGSSNNQDLLSKLVLARMNNIEEGFREVIKEVKDLRRGESSRSESRPDDLRDVGREKKKRTEKKDTKNRSQGSRKSKSKASSESFWSDDPTGKTDERDDDV
ncbi:hypothetical protein ASPWEDRAFT_107132 [Aspergillus wentii DTO 134E9]|uniref:Uncharacterized protein n=1 Tax=Aspergillus wentii DTO 134E9 TaxID=1073089 RepID=A0A1L9RS72_ASPWE|nr:uncharacterized protein ASPWEDRAFT_107132 [Aspergillus wentii DTO 134E9]KAI9930593.1 hypothetical protein MW887_011347 [Aspergillus wentii]OJJ37754.1 hypothetical protein ASPWEDRAFT_107132 [Aspergillus wentii DTO 134E9]